MLTDGLARPRSIWLIRLAEHAHPIGELPEAEAARVPSRAQLLPDLRVIRPRGAAGIGLVEGAHVVIQPPSTRRSIPLTAGFSRRNRTASTMSAISVSRFVGVRATM